MSLELMPADSPLLQSLLAEPVATLNRICTNGDAIRSVILEVAKATLALYERNGCEAPWIGYLARDGGHMVGTCSFASPPKDGAAEVAYFTFPPYEGRGISTAMTGLLIAIAFRDPNLHALAAYTLPAENASTRILHKHGFLRDGVAEDPDAGEVWRWTKATARLNA